MTSRSKRKGRIIASLVLTLSILLACSYAALGATQGAKHTESYTVKPGDTLWAIALKFDPSQDTRKVVWEIEQANGISDSNPVIWPGEVLQIPVN